jgi:hypothetical protein
MRLSLRGSTQQLFLPRKMTRLRFPTFRLARQLSPAREMARFVCTRARGLDDKLVSRIGLDRLPVDQAPCVLKSAPHKLSAHPGPLRFHYCQPGEKRLL